MKEYIVQGLHRGYNTRKMISSWGSEDDGQSTKLHREPMMVANHK